MHGYQHKAMGTAAAIGTVIYAARTGNIPMDVAFPAAVCMPFGAMIPDIDHDRSKLGRKRKAVTSTAKVLLPLAALAGGTFLLWQAYCRNGTGGVLYLGVIILAILLVLKIASRNKFVQGNVKFCTKHRGIMHSLIPPILCILASRSFYIEYLSYLLYGLAIGDVVHIIGDMMTVSGAPILFPLTQANIRLLPFDTEKNAGAIQMMCWLWCIAFIAAGCLL